MGCGTITAPFDSIVQTNISLEGDNGNAVREVERILLTRGIALHGESLLTPEVDIYERQEVIYQYIPFVVGVANER